MEVKPRGVPRHFLFLNATSLGSGSQTQDVAYRIFGFLLGTPEINKEFSKCNAVLKKRTTPFIKEALHHYVVDQIVGIITHFFSFFTKRYITGGGWSRARCADKYCTFCVSPPMIFLTLHHRETVECQIFSILDCYENEKTKIVSVL